MPLSSSSTSSSNNARAIVTHQNSDNEKAIVDNKERTDSSVVVFNENDYSPAVVNLLEQPPASFPFRAIVASLVFFSAIAAWAWFGKVEEVGKAQGKLVAENRTYKVESTINGRVQQLSISEGDTVEEGEVLSKLEAEEVKQEINKIEERLENYQTQLSQKQNLLEVKTSELSDRQDIVATELQIQEIAIANAQEKINSKKEQLETLERELAQNKQRVERLQPLQEEGAISEDFVFEAQQTLQNTQMKVLNMESEIQATKKEAERLKEELTQKQTDKNRSRLEAEQKIQQLELEIEEHKNKIAEAKNQLAIAKSKQKEAVLKSPIDGKVSSLNLQNTGEFLEQGKTVAEISPQDNSLVLDAKIPDQEAGFIEKGMPVQIKFDAYPYQDYGVVPGKVSSMSPDSETNKKGTFYNVEIALERNYINHNQEKINFQAGQSATAEIVTRRRRIAEVIFEPLQKLEEGGLNL